MQLKKITAIFSERQLKKVESALESHGVKGFTIHPIKGRGSYSNTYSRDHLVSQTQIEIYTIEKYAKKIAQLLVEQCDVGADSEGLVAITSVDDLNWIFQHTPAKPDDFNFFEVDHG